MTDEVTGEREESTMIGSCDAWLENSSLTLGARMSRDTVARNRRPPKGE